MTVLDEIESHIPALRRYAHALMRVRDGLRHNEAAMRPPNAQETHLALRNVHAAMRCQLADQRAALLLLAVEGMMRAMMFVIALALAAMQVPTAQAGTELYQLDGTGSQVAFSTDFGGGTVTGRFPVSEASLRLDFDNLANSSVRVTLNAASGTANSPFAVEAMKGQSILDARHHPHIVFRSTSVTQRGDAVLVAGNLTIRGVTRPTVLRASLSRRSGSDPARPDHLRVRLTGTISRSAFGASGWSDAVGDKVRLDITAQISRVAAR